MGAGETESDGVPQRPHNQGADGHESRAPPHILADNKDQAERTKEKHKNQAKSHARPKQHQPQDNSNHNTFQNSTTKATKISHFATNEACAGRWTSSAQQHHMLPRQLCIRSLLLALLPSSALLGWLGKRPLLDTNKLWVVVLITLIEPRYPGMAGTWVHCVAQQITCIGNSTSVQ